MAARDRVLENVLGAEAVLASGVEMVDPLEMSRACHQPKISAKRMSSGNGTLKKNTAMKDKAAMICRFGFPKTFLPMRISAAATKAMTAGFNPSNAASTAGMDPKCT